MSACSTVVLLVACGEGPTEITAGRAMSVADQVSIEAALGSVADELDRTGQSAGDSLLSDLTRIAARLIRLQGREGELTVSGFPTGAPSGMLSAVSLVTTDETPGGAGHLHLVVAWEGLDNAAYTVRRALVLLVPSGSGMTGTFALQTSSQISGARVIDFSRPGAAGFARSGAGSLTVRSAEFRGSCPGIVNTAREQCEVGRETVAGEFVAQVGGETPSSGTVRWDEALLPSFRLTIR